MCRLIGLVVTIFLLSSTDTQRITHSESDQLPNLLVSGKIVSENSRKSQVAVFFNQSLICGGNILRNNIVITAAECVRKGFLKKSVVRAGSSTFKKGGQVRKVREAIVHPKYNVETKEYNVALLHLMRPFNFKSAFIEKVQLPSNNIELPLSLFVYGWGISNQKTNQTPTKNIRELESRVYSSNRCHQYLTDASEKEEFFCMGDKSKHYDICNDDPGAGAIDRNRTLFGIVSESGACHPRRRTTVFTRISRVALWIEEVIYRNKTKI